MKRTFVFLVFFSHQSLFSCAFCDPDILQRQTFYEDELVLGLYTHKPIVEGHCLIIPKRHVERFEDLTAQEITQIGEGIQKVDKAAQKIWQREAYLLLQKNGKEVGQTVFHVHFHYIPRKKGENSTLKFLFKMFWANLFSPISSSEMETRVKYLKETMLEMECID